MEPSQASGEFSGNNESGWTAYIGSHIRTETGYSDDEDVKGVEDDGNNGHNHDDESDDSMASDASSGPSHLQYLARNSEGSHGSDKFTKHKDNDHKSLRSGERTSKQASKRRYGRNVEVTEEEEEEDDLLVEADSAASSHV